MKSVILSLLLVSGFAYGAKTLPISKKHSRTESETSYRLKRKEVNCVATICVGTGMVDKDGKFLGRVGHLYMIDDKDSEYVGATYLLEGEGGNDSSSHLLEYAYPANIIGPLQLSKSSFSNPEEEAIGKELSVLELRPYHQKMAHSCGYIYRPNQKIEYICTVILENYVESMVQLHDYKKELTGATAYRVARILDLYDSGIKNGMLKVAEFHAGDGITVYSVEGAEFKDQTPTTSWTSCETGDMVESRQSNWVGRKTSLSGVFLRLAEIKGYTGCNVISTSLGPKEEFRRMYDLFSSITPVVSDVVCTEAKLQIGVKILDPERQRICIRSAPYLISVTSP